MLDIEKTWIFLYCVSCLDKHSKEETTLYSDFTTEFIGLPHFFITSWEKHDEKDYLIHLTPVEEVHLCPLCERISTNHSRSVYRVLRHRYVPGWATVFVRIPIFRQRCTHCSLTWTVEWDGIPPRSIATASYKQMCVQHCFQRDIKSTAKELGLPYTTLERWYYEIAPAVLPDPETNEAPKVVCLDEFAILKGHKYGLNLMDHDTGHVWKVSKGRSRNEIQSALNAWPFNQPPQVVVTDLAPGMAETVAQVWKDSTIVVDKFHVIQLFSTSLEVRRKLSDFRGSHRKGRHEQRLLHKDPTLLKDEEKIELHKWLNQDADLERLYHALQQFRHMYRATTLQAGIDLLDQWIQQHRFSPTGALRRIAKTIIQWRKQIEAYFIYRVTNAPIEGTHNKIKVLKRRAYGYRNIERFTMRIRLECKPA